MVAFEYKIITFIQQLASKFVSNDAYFFSPDKGSIDY